MKIKKASQTPSAKVVKAPVSKEEHMSNWEELKNLEFYEFHTLKDGTCALYGYHHTDDILSQPEHCILYCGVKEWDHFLSLLMKQENDIICNAITEKLATKKQGIKISVDYFGHHRLFLYDCKLVVKRLEGDEDSKFNSAASKEYMVKYIVEVNDSDACRTHYKMELKVHMDYAIKCFEYLIEVIDQLAEDENCIMDENEQIKYASKKSGLEDDLLFRVANLSWLLSDRK